MPAISLTMIVKNEEKHLARCLESVKGIVDEIIIVDTGSVDRTKEIAQSFGVKLFDFNWIDDFSAARNYAIDKSTGNWNLMLDADEYITNDCRGEIHRFVSEEPHIGRIKLTSIFKQDGETRQSNVYLSRLLPKGVRYTGRIHEQVDSDLPRVNVDVSVAHDGYMHVDKTDRNLRILLMELQDNPNDDYVLYQVGKQYKLMDQYMEAERYFDKSYELCRLEDWYRSSLVVDYLYVLLKTKSFEKGFQLIKKEKERFADLPDFHFAAGLFYMELIFFNIEKYIHLFSEIEQSFLRCLAIGETDKYDSVLGTGSFMAAHNLGVFYETAGNKDKALFYYKQAASEQYAPSLNRLTALSDK